MAKQSIQHILGRIGTKSNVFSISFLFLLFDVTVSAQRWPDFGVGYTHADFSFGAGGSSMGNLSLALGGSYNFNLNEVGMVLRTNSEEAHYYAIGSGAYNAAEYADRLTEFALFFGRNVQHNRFVTTFRGGVSFLIYKDYYISSYQTTNWWSGSQQTAYSLHSKKRETFGGLFELEETIYLGKSFGISARLFMNVNPEWTFIGMTGSLKFVFAHKDNTELDE